MVSATSFVRARLQFRGKGAIISQKHSWFRVYYYLQARFLAVQPDPAGCRRTCRVSEYSNNCNKNGIEGSYNRSVAHTIHSVARRVELEDLWRSRAEERGSEYRHALSRWRRLVREHSYYCPGEGTSVAEVHSAYSAACAAREEYRRVLRIFIKLILCGGTAERT
jgi:hypothetical protein